MKNLIKNTKDSIFRAIDPNVSISPIFWNNLYREGKEIERNIHSLKLLKNIYYGEREYNDNEMYHASYPIKWDKEY